MANALQYKAWVDDIRGTPSVPAIAEFLVFWSQIQRLTLQDSKDGLTWRLTSDGRYSARLTYGSFFLGREFFPCVHEQWSSWAPLELKIFAWLALRNRLWTADRLAARHLDHPPSCVLCCQQPETTTHLLLACPFAREIWYNTLIPLCLHRFTPNGDATLSSWWSSLSAAAPTTVRKEINSLVIPTTRHIWLERNRRVFNRKACLLTPNVGQNPC